MRGDPPKVRFMRLVSQEPNTGCWLWLGSATRYGRFWFNSKKPTSAHRAAWILFRGAIPDGLSVCHKCDMPPCANPDHLFLGTHRENMLDAGRKGRLSVQLGERHHHAKLSLDQVREIRALRGQFTARELGVQFGVSACQISAVQTGRAWRHSL